MSSKENIELNCPNCGKKQTVSIWKSINTSLNPEMKEAVRNKSAFKYTCPDCGYETILDYGFLYHQMSDRFMIQYVQTDESAEKVKDIWSDENSPMMRIMREKHYLMRIVRTQNELLEKIEIFDAGLDDRIVELCKMFILIWYSEQKKEDWPDEVLYYRQDEDNYVQLLSNGNLLGDMIIPKTMYDMIKEDYQPFLAEIWNGGFFVNQSWALETFQTFKDHVGESY